LPYNIRTLLSQLNLLTLAMSEKQSVYSLSRCQASARYCQQLSH